MKKLPKLYTKNDKGRYEEYQIPDLDVSETLYRRINGKYIPVSYQVAGDELPEGVWVVTRGPSSREYISGQYLKEVMRLDRVSDIQDMPNLAELGGWKKCAEWIIESGFLADIDRFNISAAEYIYAIVGKMFEYSKMFQKSEQK